MNTGSAFRQALRPFETRAMRMVFFRSAALGVVIAAVASEAAWAAGGHAMLTLAAVLAAGTGIGLVLARRRCPTPTAIARQIDRAGRLNDLVVTALECADATGEIADVIRRDAIAALRNQHAGAAFPLEPPRHWRRVALAALVAQVALLPLAWRPPSERPQQSALTSLMLPNGGGAAAPLPGPPNSPAAAPKTGPADAPAAGDVRAADHRGTPVAVKAAPEAADGATDVLAGGRLRLAAANAADDVAAGRVPIARRDIVSRYFAALQLHRKRPPQ